MVESALKAPFPWFGGKSRIAKLVWDRLGDVDNFVEPFCGSAAVLLARPHPPRIETVNDSDCALSNFERSTHPERGNPTAVADAVCEVINDADAYLANAWRSIQRDPEQTAAWADSPVDESYLHAVHRWLVLGEDAAEFRRRMRTDPDYCDPKRAGRWIFGLCCWIGSGWCQTPESAEWSERPSINKPGGLGVHAKGEGRPQLADAYSRGRGVHNDNHLSRQLPDLSSGHGTGLGRGIHGVGSGIAGTCAQRRAWLLDWFNRLRDRLRTVRVCCGNWTRVCSSDSVTVRLGTTGVFLDPPYGILAGRNSNLYAVDDLLAAPAVRKWCLEWGKHPQMRIALCGYAGEGHEELEALGWQVVAWKASGGYGNRTEQGKENAARERIWFSPACINQKGLFDSLEDA